LALGLSSKVQESSANELLAAQTSHSSWIYCVLVSLPSRAIEASIKASKRAAASHETCHHLYNTLKIHNSRVVIPRLSTKHEA
jgi:hypothetical protein